MKRFCRILLLASGFVWVWPAPSQAQIRYLTVRAPHFPLPPMVLVQTNNTHTAAAQAPAALAAPVRPPPLPLPKPSLDKAELERRVVEFQKKRAQEGSPSAQYELGMRYWNGNGVEQDHAAARKWLRLAAEGGDVHAQMKLQELDRPVK